MAETDQWREIRVEISTTKIMGTNVEFAKQAVVTTVFGSHSEQLSRTFTSFAQNRFLSLHAFIIGDSLPRNRCPEITYHLRKPDAAYSHPYREVNYRRWEVMDELDAEYAVVVDALDVICLQELPQIPQILRGASVAACVEHEGGRYMFGSIYTSTYLNAGVTFWDVHASKEIRSQIIERGRCRYRALTDDQLTFNEIVHQHFDSLRILPCQYNYRPFIQKRYRRWPTCQNLDGVKIYHHDECLKAKQFLPVKPEAELPPLEPDFGPISPLRQFIRRIQHRLKPHLVR
jgi:hypothetical protein